MWFFCGLGNPGKKYENTRHNIGLNIIDSIINNYRCKIYKKDSNKEIYLGSINKKKCIFVKPLSFMNFSGLVVQKVINFYKIPKSKIIIIHDDLDLKLGKIKIKKGGGSGGHNGLKSIDETIGNKYKRIRIGIGHPGSKELVSKYVLEKFSNNEKKIINNKIIVLTNFINLIFENDSLLLTKLALEKIDNNGI